MEVILLRHLKTLEKGIKIIREERRPVMFHAKVPLLVHHTSGVRMDFYRSEEDLAEHRKRDPFPVLHKTLLDAGVSRGRTVDD